MAATRSSKSSTRSRGSQEKSGSKTNPDARGTRSRPTRSSSAKSNERKAEAPKSRGGSSSARSVSGSRSSKSAASGRKSGARASKSKGRTARGAGQSTTDHEVIRQWVEARGGKPACVRGTGGKSDTGMLRIDMPGYTGADKLAPISWEEWFGKFDEKGLAFLYQEQTADGTPSNFNKLVNR